MRKIRRLSKETIKVLKRIEASSRDYKVRQRALCIQLSYKNYTIKELSNLFQVTYLTIQRWLDKWDKESLVGLYDKKGRGRKSTFDSRQKQQIKAWAKENPKQLQNVQSKIQETWNIKTSTYTIKRILKN